MTSSPVYPLTATIDSPSRSVKLITRSTDFFLNPGNLRGFNGFLESSIGTLVTTSPKGIILDSAAKKNARYRKYRAGFMPTVTRVSGSVDITTAFPWMLALGDTEMAITMISVLITPARVSRMTPTVAILTGLVFSDKKLPRTR